MVERRVRVSSIAGSWYPGTESALRGMVDRFLDNAAPPHSEEARPLALFVPHAGYIYSGHVAAEAYHLLASKNFTRVVLVGPSHYRYLGPWATTDFTHYQTPLGLVPVDEGYLKRLSEALPLPRMRENQEHSLEIQLPFLQRALGDFSILPLLLGDQDLKSARLLAEALASLGGDGDTLVVASSDLSHYHDAQTAERIDRRLLSHLQALDVEPLAQDLEAGECEACGAGAILTAMILARLRGAKRAEVRKYAHSGEVSGDYFQVVGYAAACVHQPELGSKAQS